MRFSRIATGVGAGLGLLGAGLGMGWAFRSPDERVTVDLPTQVLTAPVESRALTEELTGSGTFGTPATVAVSVTAPQGMTAVVTAQPLDPGQVVTWCQPVIEVSGRPVLALHGTLPAYRDLTVGDTGADVAQLQQALRECGLSVTVDGVFGPHTASALRSLYRNAGYAPVTDVVDALGPGEPSSTAQTAPAATGASNAPASEVSQVLTVVHGTPAQRSRAVDAHPTAADTSATADSPADAPSADGASTPTPSPPPTVVAPRGELLFVATEPRAVKVAPPGLLTTGTPAATLALAGDQFVMTLTAAQRAAVTAGQQATITYGTWTQEVALPQLPDNPTINDSGAPMYPVTIALGADAPEGAYGQPGDFSITVGSDAAYDFVVPVSALYQDTAGQDYLLLPGAQSPTRVDVEVLATAAGYVAIDPGQRTNLEAGDEVIVGAR